MELELASSGTLAEANGHGQAFDITKSQTRTGRQQVRFSFCKTEQTLAAAEERLTHLAG